MRSLDQQLKRLFILLVESLAPPVHSGMNAIPAVPLKKILIVRQHDQLGDVLISTPAIRAVRKRFPDAYIAVVVREYTASMMLGNPYVDKVIVFSEKLHYWTWKKWRRFWRDVRGDGGYDCAIVLNTVSRSMTSDIIAVLSRARTIVGPRQPSHDNEQPERIYTIVTERDPIAKSEIKRNLDIVKALGAVENNHEYDFVLTEEEKAQGLAVVHSMGMKSPRPVLGVHLGAENPAKCLPLETLAKVIDESFETFGYDVVLLHGPGEENRLEKLIQLVTVPVHAAPVLPLRIAAALIGRCTLFLCNDTGTLHIASGLRVPTVSFHALTDPAIWKPAHPRHVGIYAADGNIGSITAKEILRAIEKQRLYA
jgi:ADP-heptose:LPS heptosyltransferase